MKKRKEQMVASIQRWKSELTEQNGRPAEKDDFEKHEMAAQFRQLNLEIRNQAKTVESLR